METIKSPVSTGIDSRFVGEMNCNSETEEETIAVRKKRSRRVSFAENTSVHIFDRDDEYETPPEPKPSLSAVETTDLGHSSDDLGFRQDSSDGNDAKEFLQNEEEEDEDEDAIDARGLFLRPMESPSSGSGFGSATSNDEDHFFGPVSASFIRPGRLSDSAPSDDNHEVTMDSTAFSMNFRSLAKSDSGGELLTSTGVHLSFEEKTPTQDSVPVNQGNSMVLTVAKRPISLSSLPTAKLGNYGDSNDMSLVGENSHRYDYGRLSPGLDKLLAETSKALHASEDISYSMPQDNTKSKLLPTKDHGDDHIDTNGNEDQEMVENNIHHNHTDIVFDMHDKLDQVNGGSTSSFTCPKTSGFSFISSNTPSFDVPSPIQSTRVLASDESMRDDLQMRTSCEISTVGCGTMSNLDSKGPQSVGFTSEGWKSPLVSSIASLSTKRMQNVGGGVGLLNSSNIVTPTQKQASFLVRNEDKVHGASESAIRKSISKLELLEASPFSYTLSSKIGSSNLRSLHYFHTTPLDSVVGKNLEGTHIKHLDDGNDDPLNSLTGEDLSSIFQKKGKHRDDQSFETPKETKYRSHSEELRSPLKSGISPNVSTRNLCADQLSKESASMTFRPQSICSPEKIQLHLLPSEDACEGRLVTVGSDSSSVDITIERMEGKEAIGMPNKFYSSEERRLERNLSTFPDYQVSESQDLITSGQQLVPKGEVVNASSSNATANRCNSLVTQNRMQSTSPINDLNYFRALTETETLDDGKISFLGRRDNLGTMRNSPRRTPDKNSQTKREEVRNALAEELGSAATFRSASPDSHRSANDPSIRKNLVEWFAQSPLRKAIQNVKQNYNIHSIDMDDEIFPESNQTTNEVENFSMHKRSKEEISLQDEMARIQKRPKLSKSGVSASEVSKSITESGNGASTSGHELKHWVDIHSKISEDLTNLLSPSADKLKLKITVLDDIMVHLLRIEKYEILHSEMQSKKTLDPLSNLQHKRVAETKLLLHKLVDEQTKLQIMHLKRKRLQEIVQQVRSRIQECQMLRLNPLVVGPQQLFDEGHIQPLGGMQAAHDKITAMERVLEDSTQKITNMTKSFHTHCKINGEPDFAFTIGSVNDYLTRRMCCRFLRLDLQLWDIDNLESWNGHQNVVLHYLGFIKQRLDVVREPVSVISVSNELHNINIIKNLPDMDVCTAFAFGFDAKSTRKYIGIRSLAEETQISSSILGNILDVVQEVQLARLEQQNLIQSTFHSDSVEQLNLRLCFIDFKSGRKAILTFDLSCLKSGVYPSEILPTQIAAPADETRDILSQQFLADIRAAVKGLRIGFLRILRICWCVSRVIEASSR